MDRELADALQHLPQLPFSDLAATRAGFDAMLAAGPSLDRAGVTVEDRAIPGPEGARS